MVNHSQLKSHTEQHDRRVIEHAFSLTDRHQLCHGRQGPGCWLQRSGSRQDCRGYDPQSSGGCQALQMQLLHTLQHMWPQQERWATAVCCSRTAPLEALQDLLVADCRCCNHSGDAADRSGPHHAFPLLLLFCCIRSSSV